MNKNITFSADEDLIEKARLRAQKERQSLNKVFNNWLKHYASREKRECSYDSIMEVLSYVRPGKKYSRSEMNER